MTLVSASDAAFRESIFANRSDLEVVESDRQKLKLLMLLQLGNLHRELVQRVCESCFIRGFEKVGQRKRD